MIRRSTVIAIAAILLSFSVHFVGLSVTSSIQPEQPVEGTTNDVVALGNAFEDIAETLPEPVRPENTPPPEPETETVPQPDLAETPTSEVLVASPNPQRTNSPGTGTAQVVQPDTTGPTESEQGRIPEPETVEPSAGVAVASPVVPVTNAEAPKGDPNVGVDPIEVITSEPVLRPPVAAASQPLAALPVIALKPEMISPETPETTVTTTPEEPETVEVEDELGGSERAVVSSLRPTRRPSEEPIGMSDGSTEFSELLLPPLIESPLTAYLRDGTDPNIQKNGSGQSSGLGFIDSRGPGNTDVTNYAGQVLIQLNRAPAVHASGRGSARVFFEINPDGTLGRIDIIDSTGSPNIARAAKAQVRRAAPFPRPPQGVIRRLSFVYWNN